MFEFFKFCEGILIFLQGREWGIWEDGGEQKTTLIFYTPFALSNMGGFVFKPFY